MLAACRRNTAFMYLGVASRAAVALGFHADFSLSVGPDDSAKSNERSRLWSLSAGDSSEVLTENPAHSQLAAACVDSAIYMLQTCLEVHQSSLLLRNMCKLKAFFFAAALVLGFSMFSCRDIDSEIDDVFRGALTILHVMASQSAQAVHYLNIVTKLEAAIGKQRHQLAAQARQRRGQYVNRIFNLNESSPIPRTQNWGGVEEETRNENPLLSQTVTSCAMLHSDDGTAPPASPPMIGGTLFDRDGMDLP
ncbi:Activator of stress genes [Penicillium digitatum]|nr:Activator of stress genes [Penicillium digitatum]